MAFVPTPGALFGANSFSGTAVSRAPAPRVATLRMEAESSPSEFGKAGKSMWKENVFTGGFPGGEEFYKAWAEDGMTKDVPDVPEAMQPRSSPSPETEEKKGLLAKLDATEFFSAFTGKDSSPAAPESDVAEPERLEAAEPKTPAMPDAPNPALYEQYYPEAIRNLAPDIDVVYGKSFLKDRVGVAMTEVTASCADVYYPKDLKNKAPMIDICYTGSIGTSSVVFYLADVDPLPTLPPPPKAGDAVTVLTPGSGGGLKLEYSIAGAGAVDI